MYGDFSILAYSSEIYRKSTVYAQSGYNKIGRRGKKSHRLMRNEITVSPAESIRSPPAKPHSYPVWDIPVLHGTTEFPLP